MVDASSRPGSPLLPRVFVGCTAPEAVGVRVAALDAYREARSRNWPFLSDVLERAARRVDEQERGTLTAVVHALVKYDRLLDFVVDRWGSGDRLDVLLSMARGEHGEVCAHIDRIETATERLGVAFSVPDWLVERLRDELGEPALESALVWMNEPAPRVARVNTLKTNRENCVEALAKEGVVARATPHAAHGILLGGRRSPFRTEAFARGEFEIQDEASQWVAELVAPPNGSFIVDACAGAGGKTLALAALLGGKGRVVALDASESKLTELRRRARRAGASNVRAVRVDLLGSADALREFEGRATRVLLDAPCSGLGAIRRNPEARWRLRPTDFSRLADAQSALMRAAAGLVSPRGRLIFATCSFLPSEGERVIESFLTERPDFTRVTVRDVLGRARTEAIATADGAYLRTQRFDGSRAPGADEMDGFFAAVARRAASAA